MTYCWKEEYAVIDNDGEEIGWFDTLEEAVKLALKEDGARIDLLRHYSTERDEVWPDEDEE